MRYPLLYSLVMSVVLAIAAAECLLRFGPLKIVAARGESVGPCHLAGVPGQRQEFSNVVCLNSVGLHDVDHERVKKAGVRRVLIVGDSYVDAAQVPLDKTFFRRLEADWNASHAREPIEVIAVGHADSGQAEQLPLLDSALRDKPDVVLCFFHTNDPRDNERYLRTPGLGHEPRRDVTESMWLRWSRLELLVRYRAAQRSSSRTMPSHYSEEQWRLTEGLLARMERHVRRHGAEFILVFVPRPSKAGGSFFSRRYRYKNDAPLRNREILERLRRLPYPLVDLSPALVAYDAEHDAGATFKYDVHWNRAGHAVVAAALRRVLEERRFAASGAAR